MKFLAGLMILAVSANSLSVVKHDLGEFRDPVYINICTKIKGNVCGLFSKVCCIGNCRNDVVQKVC